MRANLEIALEYGASIVRTPYVWWLGETILGQDKEPFWAANVPAPNPEFVKSKGVCCTGVLNLMRRRLGLPVPGVAQQDPLAGGTGAWYEFLQDALEPFDSTVEYPVGTIFFRPYQSFEDQGHIGVKLEKDQILHSYSDGLGPRPGHVFPGCTIDTSWKDSHSWSPNGYWLYTAPPNAWLF